MLCLKRKPELRRSLVRVTLSLFFIPLSANAADAPTVVESSTLVESFGPLSSSPRGELDQKALFLGGILQKKDDDDYRRLINTGADPSKIPGPEKIYFSPLSQPLITSEIRPVLELPGYHVNDPSAFRPAGSSTTYLYFSRGPNSIAESCRKKGESLRSCPEYLDARELMLATSADEGLSFTVKAPVVSKIESGDENGPGQPAALMVGNEVWLYYGTGKQSFMKENLFRLRLSLEGKRLAAPQPIQIDGFTAGSSFENIQLVWLKCSEGNKFVVTMVANNRQENALPLFMSEEGLRFKLAATSLISSSRSIYSPTQMPGPASVQECQAMKVSGLITQRTLLYSERFDREGWKLQRTIVRVTLP